MALRRELKRETFADSLIARGWVSPEGEEVVVKGRDKGPKSRMVSVQEVASSQEEAYYSRFSSSHRSRERSFIVP